jgi:hypothetical protein
MGMLLTTSAIHMQIMEIRLSIVKPSSVNPQENLLSGNVPCWGE